MDLQLYKDTCKQISSKYKKIEVIFDVELLNKKVLELENKTFADDFWNDNKKANIVLKEIKNKDTLHFYNALSNQYDLLDLFLSDNIESNNVSPDSIVELKFIELVDNLEIKTIK